MGGQLRLGPHGRIGAGSGPGSPHAFCGKLCCLGHVHGDRGPLLRTFMREGTLDTKTKSEIRHSIDLGSFSVG